MGSKATKPPAQQGGPAPDRAGTAVNDPSEKPETGGERGLERILEEALAEARVLKEALAEARAEVARQEEIEQKLDRVRIEAASLAIELNQAERDLEEARNTVKPKTAERIAKLDAELVQTRSELVRERASRERIERDYDAAALQSGTQLKQLREDAEGASTEAERARAEAERARAEADKSRAAHEKELEDLRRAHEKELAAARQALTREEAGRNRDREQLAALERLLEAATKETGEPAAAGTKGYEQAAHARAAARERRAAPEADAVSERTSERTPADAGYPLQVGGRRRKRIFESRGRTCAVCRRTEVSSPGALKATGWALGSEIDLCPGCQEKGWQLPRSGSLPFRRSSHRDEVG